MNLVFDIVNVMLTLWIKPMLVLLCVMYVVSKPDFRSAATNHWLLLLAVLSPVLLLVFFLCLPRIDVGILPTTIAAYTQANIFSLAHSPLAHPNILTLVLVSAYLSGTFLLMYKMFGALLQTRSLVKHSYVLRTKSLQLLQAKLADEFAVSKAVEIRISNRLTAPVVWGWLHPQIILPLQATSWNQARLQRVLAHEYAHIARGDWLSKLLSHVVCALFWMNPLMWRAAKQCAWQAELACDDLVISKFKCRAEYADDLLELSTDACHHSLATVAFIKKSELYLRINAILDGGKNRSAPGYVLKAVLFSLILLMLLPLSVLQAKQSPYALRGEFSQNDTKISVYSLGEKQLILQDYPGVPGVTGEPDYITPAELKKRFEKLFVTDSLASSRVKPSAEQLAKLEIRNYNVSPSPEVAADFKFDSVDVVPLKPLKIITPKYPERALQRSLEATVIVNLDVDIEGRVRNAKVISTDHSKMFNSSVLRALKDFRYQPMTIDGQAIITRNVKETFVFTLKDTTGT